MSPRQTPRLTATARWQKIARWMQAHRDEISQAPKGHIHIDYAGQEGISFEISRREESEEAGQEEERTPLARAPAVRPTAGPRSP